MGITVATREIEDNSYAKCWWVNMGNYCSGSLLDSSDHWRTGEIVVFSEWLKKTWIMGTWNWASFPVHPSTIEILPLIRLICFSVVHKCHLRFYDSLIRFKKLRVTWSSWPISRMTSCAAPKNIRFLVVARCLSWDFGRNVQHLPLSLNYCVPSFDQFCYTRIQVSVNDLVPSIIL